MFELKNFTSHSGVPLSWKIECDHLTYNDYATFAALVARSHKFSAVVGIPRGGLKFAQALSQYTTDQLELPHTLLVDDVYTTGKSMEEWRDSIPGLVTGIVVFARTLCPIWVRPIFYLANWVGN